METRSIHLSLDELQNFIAGKSVAIVGNAVSIFNDALGAEIDAHDIVIRMNYGFVKDARSQGSKTTIWAGSVALPEDDVEARFAPVYAMWMTPKRESMPDYSAVFRKKLFFHPVEIWTVLQQELSGMSREGADAPRPTTGLMLINFIVRHCTPSRVRLYGFDFFKTRTFYDRRLPKNKPHDFNAEEVWVHALCADHPELEIRKPAAGKRENWAAACLRFLQALIRLPRS